MDMEAKAQGLHTNLFNLKDKVISKKTGLPTVGMVFGIMTASMYCSMIKSTIHPYWEKLYPDCMNKSVYYVVLDEAQRNISFDEWCLSLHINKTNDTLKVYEYIVPLVTIIAYPEDDLEKFE